jgi:hypothetical protein
MSHEPKKIVLFIVEGVSDELALGPILYRLITSDLIKFKVVNGDITSDYHDHPEEPMTSKIADLVKSFLGNVFHVDDLLEIVHIVDIDGVFVDDRYVLHANIDKVRYDENAIYTKNVHEIKKRNAYKSNALDSLAAVHTIRLGQNQHSEVPYRLSYMSCNLDHVMHNERNLAPWLKRPKAGEFADSYSDQEERFLEFLHSPEILRCSNDEACWAFLKDGFNSLSRSSDLAFAIDHLLSTD